jgi:hypothetical protein
MLNQRFYLVLHTISPKQRNVIDYPLAQILEFSFQYNYTIVSAKLVATNQHIHEGIFQPILPVDNHLY